MENIYYVQYVLFPILPTFFTWEFSILKAPKYYCFIISDSCVSQNFVDTFHNLLLGWVQLEERILLLVSTPCSLLGLLFGCILVINILLTKSLHKPKHLFQALAVCSSLARWCFIHQTLDIHNIPHHASSQLFGLYGIVFLARSCGFLDSTHILFFYILIWNRYLLLLTDVLPSIDR